MVFGLILPEGVRDGGDLVDDVQPRGAVGGHAWFPSGSWKIRGRDIRRILDGVNMTCREDIVFPREAVRLRLSSGVRPVCGWRGCGAVLGADSPPGGDLNVCAKMGVRACVWCGSRPRGNLLPADEGCAQVVTDPVSRARVRLPPPSSLRLSLSPVVFLRSHFFLPPSLSRQKTPKISWIDEISCRGQSICLFIWARLRLLFGWGGCWLGKGRAAGRDGRTGGSFRRRGKADRPVALGIAHGMASGTVGKLECR